MFHLDFQHNTIIKPPKHPTILHYFFLYLLLYFLIMSKYSSNCYEFFVVHMKHTNIVILIESVFFFKYRLIGPVLQHIQNCSIH